MPYIKPDRRKELDGAIEHLVCVVGKNATAGDLNYIVSVIWKRCFFFAKNYARANELMGALECIKHEFYRRWVAPYETEKIEQNGDID